MNQKSHLRYRSLILTGVLIVFALLFLLFQYLHPGKRDPLQKSPAAAR